MSFDLVREDIKIRRLITRDSMQIILENDIIVPDTKADLEKVLFSDADVHVVRTEISEGNLAIDELFDIKYFILKTVLTEVSEPWIQLLTSGIVSIFPALTKRWREKSDAKLNM